MKQKIKKIFQIIISIVLFALIIQWVEFNELKASLAGANYFFFILALLLILANRMLMPFKWNLLLLSKNMNIGVWEAIKIYFIASFLGLYLPPTIGADSVRAYYVKSYGYNYPDIISSIVVERFLGLIALLAFGVFGCLLFYWIISDAIFDNTQLLVIALFSVVFFLGTFVASLNPILSQFILNNLAKIKKVRLLGKIFASFSDLYSSYVEYNQSRRTLYVFFGLTCIETILPIIRSYLVSLAFNVNVPIVYFFAFVPIVLLLIRLPLSIDGFGIHEGGFVYFLSLVGVSSSDGFGIGLANHLIFLIGLLPGGIFYVFLRSSKRKTIRDGHLIKNRS